MAIENMLYERQSEPGAALGAAFSDIDAIEPLGQPGHVFRRDAGPVVSDRHDGVAGFAGCGVARERDVDALARCAIFQGIFDQVLNATVYSVTNIRAQSARRKTDFRRLGQIAI